MARRKPSRLVDNPPSASPSLEHERESEEEVDPSQEESEEQRQQQEEQKTTKKSHKKPGKISQRPMHSPPSSEGEEEHREEDGSGEDGDEDSEDNTKSSPTASDFTIKPIVHTHANTSKNQQAKPTSKRALEVQKNDEKKDSSRKKSKSQENAEETKRVVASGGSGGNFVRVWSDEDEIAILKAIIDYQNQKGADPHTDMGAFHDFVKGRFRFDVTRSQVYEKVRRLKKKFLNNMNKVGGDGQDPAFSKPHDFLSFELSKKIWGGKIANGGVSNAVDENVNTSEGKVKKSGKVMSYEGEVKGDKKKREDGRKREDDKKGEDEKKREDERQKEDSKNMVEKEILKVEVTKGEEGEFFEKYPNLGASFDMEVFQMTESVRKFLKGNISLVGNEKARELEENWKMLRMDEIEIFYRRLKLMTEQTGLVMDAMKKKLNMLDY